MDKELLKGYIDILILSLLSENDMYAYEISKIILESSEGEINLAEGTLYPALKRFCDNGYLDSYWVERSNNLVKRKYYKLTDKGAIYLEDKKNDYKKLNNIIKRFL